MTKEITVPMNSDISDEMNSTVSTKFIPNIKITYGVSGHVGEDGSQVGDFFLDGKTIGKSMVVHSLAYRFQALAIDKDDEIIESIVLTKKDREDIRFKDREEYKRFIYNNKSNKIVDGFDQLLFIPEINSFGVLFFKTKLAKASAPISNGSVNGGLVKLDTVKKEWKKYNWYEILVSHEEGTVILPENTEEILKIYFSQAIVEEEEEKPSNGSTRER